VLGVPPLLQGVIDFCAGELAVTVVAGVAANGRQEPCDFGKVTSVLSFAAIPARALQPPGGTLPFGSDKQGRDMFAVMVAGMPLTLRIGLVAGFIGTFLGALLAFLSAYYGGTADNIIRGIVDVGLTVPGLMVLILIAMNLKGGLDVNQMALIVASLAWLFPARTIRSQVLTIKERGYVQVAQLSGMSGPAIIVKELLPNLLPYMVASLVGSVSSAILASIGLAVLGLGPTESPDLGMTLYWVLYNAAIINGWWWWWVPPIVAIAPGWLPRMHRNLAGAQRCSGSESSARLPKVHARSSGAP